MPAHTRSSFAHAHAPAALDSSAERKRPLQILLVEDNQADADQVVHFLRKETQRSLALRWAKSVQQAQQHLISHVPDVILLDLTLPDSSGLSTVGSLHRAAPDVPIVVLTGCDSEAIDRGAMQSHAQDFLVKGRVDRALLLRTIDHAIERHRLQHEVRRSEGKLRHLFESSLDGIVVLDAAGQLLLANSAARRLLGQHVGEIGEPLSIPWTTDQQLEVLQLEGRTVELRSIATSWDGQAALTLFLRDITIQDRSERARRRLVVQLREANDRLQRLVNLDPLTNLPNRRALEQALITEVKRARRSRTALSALLLDCDDFKRINDTLGHATGDAVLAQIAERIRNAIRTTDHVARLGGDEFMILMPEATLWESLRFAERVRLAVCSSPVITTPEPVRISVSTGACRVPYSSASVEEVLTLTRLGLRQSKTGGKNRVSANDERLEHSRDRNEAQLAQRLCDDRAFDVVSQQIMRLVDDAVVGHELLSRSSVAGFEQPNDFFRVCLERNLLTLVDLACLRNAVSSIRTMRSGGVIHVNMFPSTVLSTPADALVSLFAEASRGTTFCLEISEQQLICDPRELRYKLDSLRECGIQIALDDVGFGRTSLELLLLLEPNVVKIDGEFVRSAVDNPSQLAALQRLARIMETLHADLVAEGIENERHLDTVRDVGVAYGQGYVWGRPAAIAS
jgi:diguanylate cyclase (GGDEF)-like protein